MPMHRTCFKEGVLKACDKVCVKKGRRDQGDTWWWNKDMKEVIAKKKDAHKKMSKSGTEANKARYKNMKNRAKKVVAKAMKEAAEWELRGLNEHPNKVFKLVKSKRKAEEDIEGGRCMRGSDGRLNFSENNNGKAGKSTWKEL